MRVKENIQSSYPLSHLQEGIYFHAMQDPGEDVYRRQIYYTVSEEIRVDVIHKCLQLLNDRHDILRTLFVQKRSEQVLQVVLRKRECPFYFVDLSTRGDAREKLLHEFVIQQRSQTFNLAKDPLFQLAIVKLEQAEFCFVWTYHHILLDGWSINLLSSELNQLYELQVSNQAPELPAAVQFADYIRWLNAADKQPAVAFWKNYLDGYHQMSGLPKHPGRGPREAKRKTYTFRMGAASPEKYKGLFGKGVTLNTFFFTVWGILLAKYNNVDDVVFGVVSSGRNISLKNAQNIVGVLTNTLPLRVRYEAETSFDELVKSVGKDLWGTQRHQALPLVEIQQLTSLKSNLLNHIILGMTETADPTLPEDKFLSDDLTNYELDIHLTAFGDHYAATLNYAGDSYDEEQIHGVARHFSRLVDQVLSNPGVRVRNLELATEEERAMLDIFSNGEKRPLSGATLASLFQRQVHASPHRTALVSDDQCFTFQYLDQEALKLASELREKYLVGPQAIVAVLMDRSPWMIIALLAIHKLRAAYLPLDKNFPMARIQYVIQDAAVHLVVADGPLDQQPCPVFILNGPRIAQPPNTVPLAEANDTAIANVLYTSGSTGNPKGVLSTHKGLVNRLEWMWDEYHFNTKDIFVQKTPYVFDVAGWEIFLPLCFGAKLVLAPHQFIYQPFQLTKLFEKECVTTAYFTPSLYQAFLTGLSDEQIHECRTLGNFFCSGEELPVKLAQLHHKNFGARNLFNLYGPTEASIDVTHYTILGTETEVPIGKPIRNLQVYVLDQHHNLQPVGVKGEIFLGGVGLAEGYLNKPELTRERFIENPFCSNCKLYRTGDIGCWLPSGQLKYDGRTDAQVKINGQRVELGEIANSLLAYPGIANAFVLYSPEIDDRRLVGFYQATSAVDEGVLKEWLSSRLPSYMIPSLLLWIDMFPLTVNGKIDREKLIKMIRERAAFAPAEIVLPRTWSENILCQVWQEVLHLNSPCGIQDDFFDLGGHSIKAIHAISMIYKETKCILNIQDFYRNPTIARLAIQLEKAGRVNVLPIVASEEQDFYSASPAQWDLYSSVLIHESDSHLNIYNFFSVQGKLESAKFENAFREVVKKHEVLRTVFMFKNGSLFQKITPVEQLEFRIDYADLSKSLDSNQSIDAALRSLQRTRFNLKNGPLLKIALLQLAPDAFLVGIVIHHIVFDGWSTDILIEDFIRFYSNANKGSTPIKVQYKDYVNWQNGLYKDDVLNASRKYWIQKLKQAWIPKSASGRDQPSQGRSLVHTLPAPLVDEIRGMNRKNSVTLYVTLLATLSAVFVKLTGQSQIIIESPVSGRFHPDLEGQIGYYINKVLVISHPREDQFFDQLLRECREEVATTLKHQQYPFLEITKALSEQGKVISVDIGLTLNSAKMHPLGEIGFSVEPYDLKASDIDLKAPLWLYVSETDEHVTFTYEYDAQTYDTEILEKMHGTMMTILAAVTKNPSIRIDDVMTPFAPKIISTTLTDTFFTDIQF